MGTTFANLQIRSDCSALEIEKVLPGCVVRCLSDGWTTIVSEHFHVGDIQKAAKKLSKAITPSVMSIEYLDDDMLKLSVYRNGKTLTSHIAGGEGYGLPRTLGKPAVFLEQFGFEPSEIILLRAILICEDIGKKIELLQHFLGVTIWIDHTMLLDDPEAAFCCKRELPIIEEYINETAIKRRIKNQTKATLLQEFEGALIAVLGDHKYLIGVPPYDRYKDCYKDELIYTFIPNGTLEPMLDVHSFNHRSGTGILSAARGYIGYISFLRSQYYVFDYTGRMVSETSLGGNIINPFSILEDGGFLSSHNSGKTLREYTQRLETRWEIPYMGFPYYNNNAIYMCRIDSSGQFSELVKLNRNGQVVASFHLEYDGYHGPNGEFVFDESGRVFYYCSATTPGRPVVKIFVLTEQLELIRELDLEGWSISVALDSRNYKLYVYLSYKQLLVIDTKSFRIIYRKKWEEDSNFFTVDSYGRALLITGSNTIEIIDSQLNVISRHRLKGQVLSEYTNERGNLCLLTGTGGEHHEGGAKKMMIRVYEICD
ncbi:hypothetical protein RB620_17755 [Paenibacillus sp. LHD-117]|uniref:YncE family protein n=1 Tax=Paenibacillus sp. LHD-117 TaxID=3071412 RepID=UPI0027E03C53|nr:hypothetical protein [Paenibacillus sp. LHD-117]MDQ6421273.1 hypothetical protein [Paenibacillus sp. LHD-117]